MMKKKAPAPFVLPAIFWLGGLLLSSVISFSFYVLLSLFIVFSGLFFIRKIRLYALLILISIFAFMRFQITQILPGDHISNVLEINTAIIQPLEGKIVSEVIPKNGLNTFSLEISRINSISISGKIRFSTKTDELRYGDEIRTIARINKLIPASNPFAFDYENLMKRRRIYGSGYSLTPVEKISSSPHSWQSFVINIRRFLRQRIESRFSPYQGFVKAITLGDKSEINETRELLNKAGLSHILAVSGLHVGVISLILFQFFIILFRSRNLSRCLLIGSLIFYGAICNWSASVFRAVIMISLLLISQMLQRKINTNQILAASFIIITAIQPQQLLSAGFQMSFIAVFTLLNILPRISLISLDKEDIQAMKWSKKLINSILIIMFSSFILNIFLAPITMLHFKQFGFNGIIGNILGIPLIGIILPLAFLIILLPSFGSIVIIYHNAFSLLMLLFKKWAQLAADLPLNFDFISIGTGQLILIYALLGVATLCFKQRKVILRRVLSILLIVLLAGVIYPFLKHNSKPMIVTFFDCGLGDLLLIETPKNEVIMIDTGPPEKSYGHFSRSALPYFQSMGIRKLDWLLITHAHNDHYGGYEDVFAELNVKNLVITDEFKNRKIWPKVNKNAINEPCSIYTVNDTCTIIHDDFCFRILHPDLEYSDTNTNNVSLVARLDFDELSILFTGDLEKEGEHYLIEKYSNFLDCDILKVGHHGSKTSSSQAFIEAVSPEIAFISTSLQNRFSFPHAKTLNSFSFLGQNLFISGRDGAVQITSDGKKAKIHSFLSKVEFTTDLTD